MSEHIKEKAVVKSSKAIGTDIYDLVLEAKGIAGKAVAGQFVSVYCNDGARLLPRPISLCGVDKEAGTLRLVYRIAGKGTEEFSRLAVDDTVEVMGPLGNGFELGEKKAFLIGGALCVIGQILIDKTKLTPARILVGYVTTGVLLSAVGIYKPFADWAGAGATVPLTGFGHALCTGVKAAVQEKGLIGAFTGGLSATSGGITAAILFGTLVAFLFKPHAK